jgi:hypothetical protein
MGTMVAVKDDRAEMVDMSAQFAIGDNITYTP